MQKQKEIPAIENRAKGEEKTATKPEQKTKNNRIRENMYTIVEVDSEEEIQPMPDATTIKQENWEQVETQGEEPTRHE